MSPNRIVVLYAPAMERVAERLRAALGDAAELRSIGWDQFADGFPNVRIPRKLYGADVCFLASFDSPDSIQRQLGVIYAISRFGARSLRVIVPYFPGTMERMRKEGEIATVMTFARQLSATPACRGGGMVEFVIYDIHQTGERFYFSDNVLVRLESAIPLLKAALRPYPERKISVCFPDDGAHKRFGDDFPEYPHIICAKVRGDGDARVVRRIDGEARGRVVVVIDDLIQSGGTMIECGKLMRRLRAADVLGFATHFVGPDNAEERFGKDRPFSTVFVTDSHPSAARLVNRAPFRVLSLVPALLPIIREE